MDPERHALTWCSCTCHKDRKPASGPDTEARPLAALVQMIEEDAGVFPKLSRTDRFEGNWYRELAEDMAKIKDIFDFARMLEAECDALHTKNCNMSDTIVCLRADVQKLNNVIDGACV